MDFFDLNSNLTRKDLTLKAKASKFAREVMRPVSKQLDMMPADRVVATDSPLWGFMQKAFGNGYHKLAFPRSVGGPGLSPLQLSIVMEELAWGSFGLTVALNTSLDAMVALDGSEEQLREVSLPCCACTEGSVIGSFAATESDLGSDILMAENVALDAPDIQSQCRARLDGNEYIISGKNSGWVSAGSTAGSVLLSAQINSSTDCAARGIFLFSLDRPGVSGGEPQNKLGARELNQSEIYFDEVRVPSRSLIVSPERYRTAIEAHLSLTTPVVGVWATGLARAAFDEALAYTRQMQQGGGVLADRANVQHKLFTMFTKIEASRQLCRAALLHNWSAPPEKRAVEYGMAAKVFAAQTALDVTSDAIQLLGGNGISKAYIVEKLFRDARTTLLWGGSNDSLTVAGAHKLTRLYPRHT